MIAAGDKNWFGGVQYIQNLLWSFHYADLAGDGRLVASVTLIASPAFLELSPDELLEQPWLKVRVQPGRRSPLGRLLYRAWLLTRVFRCDVVYPCPNWLGLFVRRAGIAWIPDFQHRHLPEFFSQMELRQRETFVRRTLSHRAVTIVSSQDARKDVEATLPAHKAQIEVLHFHVLPPSRLGTDPEDLRQAYGLPKRYFVCANQFWEHKDHATLFRALAIAARSCPDLHLACTGRIVESRNVDFVEALLREASTIGVLGRLSLLGFLPRSHQLGLMEDSVAVIQPSLFEGWSTVVEDARAVGRPLVLSDLEVHREQAPEGSHFFRKGDHADLSGRLVDLWRLDSSQREDGGELRKQAEFRLRTMGQRFADIIDATRR